MKNGLVIFDGEIEEYFEFAVENGANHLEIDLFARGQKIELMTEGRIKNIRRLSEESGISLSLHLPYCLNPASLVPDMSKACLDYFKKALNIADGLGALWVTAHPGYYQGLVTWDWMRKEAMNSLLEFINRVLVTCGSFKIPIAIENNTGVPQSGQFFNLCNCITDFELLFDSIQSPYLGMCLDTGHANTTEGVMPFLANLYDKIINIHIHDNIGEIDDHLPPGQGSIDWEVFFEYITDNNFNGALNVEVLKDEDKRASLGFVEAGLKRKINSGRSAAS